MTDKKYIYCGIVVILLFLLPYFILGDNSYITTHDFLDSTIGHMRDILKNNVFFDMNAKLPLMYGVNRMGVVYTSPFDLKSLFFLILKPYWAIIANLILIKIIAFIGMYLLLNEYLIRGSNFISFIVSLLFCIIPFYVDYGISSAGIPLLLYSLVNLYNHRREFYSYLLVLLFACYSCIGMIGIFVCSLVFVFIVYDYYNNGRRLNRNLFLSLCILSIVYVITNWGVLYGFFADPSFVSHRKEWVNDMTPSQIFVMCYMYLIRAQYHFGDFHIGFVLIVVLIVWLLYGRKVKVLNKGLIVLAFVWVLTLLGEMARLLPFNFFTSFQFGRFFGLLPSISMLLFGISCNVLFTKRSYVLLVIALSVGAYSVGITNTEYISNLRRMKSGDNSQPSFRQFYDEELFGKIAKDLKLNQDYSVKTIALGLHPSVMEYNGFWTMDGYLNSYSLDYKKKFRSIQSRELQKDENLRHYFDNIGGSRCCLYSSEIGKEFIINKESNLSIRKLCLNTDVLRSLGCKYLFSTVEIKNYTDLKTKFVGTYTTNNSFYKIYVYEI